LPKVAAVVADDKELSKKKKRIKNKYERYGKSGQLYS